MNFRDTLERWKEEVKVSGDKTTLTDSNIWALELLIDKLEEEEKSMKETVRLIQKHIDEAGYE